jgi:hypothetical protein
MPISVPFCDLDEYPRKIWDHNGFKGFRRVKVAMADEPTFCTEILWGNNSGWPTAYGGVNAYAIKCSSKPMPGKFSDAGNGYGSFDSYEVLVEYSTNAININNSIIGWEKLYPFEHITPVQSPDKRFDSATGDPIMPHQLPHLVQCGDTYIRGYNNAPAVPAAVLYYKRCVNNAPVACFSLGVVFPAQTLMFNTYTANRIWKRTGPENFNLAYEFRFLPNVTKSRQILGWNSVWNPDADGGAGDFVTMWGSSSQYIPYPAVDFNALFY